MIGSPEFCAVKIGYGCPEERLAAFQTGSPYLLKLLWTHPGGRDLEWALHESFQRYRVRGEWFAFPDGHDAVVRIAAEVQQMAEEFPEWVGKASHGRQSAAPHRGTGAS